MRKGIVMKILVGLSGGFDSAYAAKRLLDEGHTVEGAALDMHAYTELEEARTTAEALGIPFHIVPCRSLFESAVIDYFCDEYLAARTPNPCIMCNEKVKFRALYDYAMSNGFDRIATGHYVRIAEKEGRLCIARAMDDTKDQSYMLYRVPPEILEKTVFPMGNIIKKEAHRHEIAKGQKGASKETAKADFYEYHKQSKIHRRIRQRYRTLRGAVQGARRNILQLIYNI